MPLPPSTRFGHFEISGLIGAGAMGEVYRAHDTRLDRDVAIKVLPDEFTTDRDRLRRFEYEAKTLASLNHPHIAHVYGLEEIALPGPSGPVRALVMELVDGEDLAQRIAREPIAVNQVLSLARQLAEAIAAAHEHGIVHRDLKPSNIRVTSDGKVKVLDFGIAKAGPSLAAADSAPTMTGVETIAGGIIGTAAYMSPEQARGMPVDARTDVWAFGCVLYEMLTGRRAFAGATTAETIARVLEREPDWQALPASTPESLHRLLTRCLEKDVQRRLQNIGDAQLEIEEAVVQRPPRTARDSRSGAGLRRASIAVVVVATAVLLALGVWQFLGRSAGALSPPRVNVLTSYPGIEARPTLSPDGRQVAFSWDGESQENEDIYVVMVGTDSPVAITKNPARDVSPAWKPDGSEIAFARLEGDRALIYLVSPLGHSEHKVAEFSALPVTTGPRDMNDPLLSWSPDGRWLGVSRVTAGSDHGVFLLAHDGTVRRLLLSGVKSEEYGPTAFSPDARALAYVQSGRIRLASIAAADLPVVSGPPRELTRFLGHVNGVAWTPDGREIIFGRSLYAAPTPSNLWRVPASGDREPERLDLAGVAGSPALSATTHRLAFSRRDLNVDMMTLQEGRDPATLASSTFNEFDASFSPDGTKVAFASDRTGEGNEIWVANADGTSRRPVTKGTLKPEGSPRWSPDGQWLAYDGVGEDGQRHIYVIDQAGGPIRALPAKVGSYDQVPSWSRDGKWIYFGSNRSGTEEIWRVAADGGVPQQLTTTGGGVPFESWDGRTLYYSRPVRGGREVFALPLAGGSERRLGVSAVFWNYLPAEGGLYYASLPIGSKPPYIYEVRSLDGTAQSRVLHTIRLASMSPGLSVQQGGKTILISGVGAIGQDLFRIENFR